MEKQFETVEGKDKLHAALMELNELYTYFYSEDVINISVDGFLPLNIQKNTDLVPSQAKFNAWKMISPTCKMIPRAIYMKIRIKCLNSLIWPKIIVMEKIRRSGTKVKRRWKNNVYWGKYKWRV